MSETMDPAEVSRRLKVARWLAGDVNEKGQPSPLSPEELAEFPAVAENGISLNAITEIERVLRPARPMELRILAEALNVSYEFLAGETNPIAADGGAEPEQLHEVVQRLEAMVDRLQAQNQQVAASATSEEDLRMEAELAIAEGRRLPAPRSRRSGGSGSTSRNIRP
jgi:transcriptional regulator with XRE-family HTH domain